MSKEEFMKIQTCVLKVNIHCDGCKHKVKKTLQKIEGVFKTTIDSEQGKVTVLGNVNPDVLFKKLAKSGKHAELWGSSKSTNNNQTHLANQFKNMQILDNGSKGGNKNKEGQKGNTTNNNSQPKGGQPTPQQLQQHLQHLQQMKGFQDLKLPQLKDMKMGPNPNNNNQKAIKFAEEEDFSDDDDYDEDDLDDDCDLDDDDAELDDPQHPINKMKPVTGNTPKGMPNNMMMLNGMMNGNHPQLMNAQKGAQNAAANAGGNGKKRGNGGGAGGGNGVPLAGGNNGNGGGGGGGKTGGKNGGGLPQEVNKNGGGNNGGSNGGKKGKNGAPIGVSDGFLPMGGGANGGNIGHQRAAAMNMAMGQVGGLPINQMGNIPAVQGLPAPAAMSSGGGYFQGAGPDVMPGNPYHQQQYMAAMMNQQRALGANERFQPMMHARPPPTVNYIPPYPYPYPYPHPQPDPYLHPQPDPYPHFSDENTSGCNVM
ncbi:hypothetical protein HRI_000119700 [Hibiscus trionum]|uniref:HMA domain-containing protein n=1 Tax=Hibiscus trionum TaxID=183268 RepID=A0A9W7LHR2_HIBTR|nr:hypothetical protein HRI_000119700 [Hibiscus trionum]